jgi:glycerol-3-phosphate dehydrogenase (NAD(P)+)
MSSSLKYAVFGSGSWATAIIKMLCENLDEVGWFIRKQQTIDYILSEEHNPSYLSSVELHTSKLKLASDINNLADYADILIFAVPSAFIENELLKLNIDISSKISITLDNDSAKLSRNVFFQLAKFGLSEF